MDPVLCYLFLPLFPKPMGPTTGTTQCCVCCYPRFINEKPTSSTSSSLLLQTERVTVFYLSPLASHLPHWRTPTSKQVFSLTLFAPSLCLRCSVLIIFSSLAFVNFWEIFFFVFTEKHSSSRKLKDNIKSYTYHNFPIKISTNKS